MRMAAAERQAVFSIRARFSAA